MSKPHGKDRAAKAARALASSAAAMKEIETRFHKRIAHASFIEPGVFVAYLLPGWSTVTPGDDHDHAPSGVLKELHGYLRASKRCYCDSCLDVGAWGGLGEDEAIIRAQERTLLRHSVARANGIATRGRPKDEALIDAILKINEKAAEGRETKEPPHDE